jgi:biotin carboxylase
VDSSGSRGIVKVNSPDEFEDARKIVLANTRTDHFVVEEFVEGEEFGAQAFIQDGKLEFILPHGDYIMQGDAGVPYGHYAPYDLPDAVVKDVYIQTEKALKSMKCENCALNADYIIKDGKVYVLEIGARGGGACLMDLASIYFDFGYEDGVGGYHEMIVKHAMGEHIDFFPADSSIVKNGDPVCVDNKMVYFKGGVANASRMMRSDRDGVIKAIKDEHEDDPDIISLQFDYKVGDQVRKFRVSPDRLGHVITKGRTLDDAVALLNKTMDKITIDVE